MIEYTTVLSLPFLKKSRFTGSDRGMRYCIRKVEKEELSYLEAKVCPGPFSIDETEEGLFESSEFPFTEEGRRKAVDWVNASYQKRKTLYEDVYLHPMRYYEKHHR